MEKCKLDTQDKYNFYKLKRNTKQNGRGQTRHLWDAVHKMIQMDELNSETTFDDLHEDAKLRKSVDEFIKKAYGQITDSKEQNHSSGLTSHENVRPNDDIPPNEKSKLSTSDLMYDNTLELKHEEIISEIENEIHTRKDIKKNDENSKNSIVLMKNGQRTPQTQGKREEKQHSCASKNEIQPSKIQSTKGHEVQENFDKPIGNTPTKKNILSSAIDIKSTTFDNKKKTPQKRIDSEKGDLCDKSHQNGSLLLQPKELSADKILPIFQDSNVFSGKFNTHCQQIFLPDILKSTQNNHSPIINRKPASSLRKIVPNHIVKDIGSGSRDKGYHTDSLNRAVFVNGIHRDNLEAPMIYYNPALITQMCGQEKVNNVQNSYVSYIMNEHPVTSMTHLAPQGFLDWETNLSVNTSSCQLPNEHFIPPYEESTPFWDLTWMPAWNEQATFSVNQINTTKINEANKVYNQNEPSKTYYGPAETILHSKPGIIRHTDFNVQPALITQSHCLRN